MPRTLDDILQEMLTAKAATSELDGLTSDSQVAVWRLLLYVPSAIIWGLESTWAIFSQEVDARIERKRVHGLYWYAKQARNFRDGVELNWVAERETFAYPEPGEGEDISGQLIVTHAAVHEAPGVLRIKVATTDSTGLLHPITDPQAERVEFYMNQIKDAGNTLEIVNLPPDELRVEGVVIYDPLLLNPDGTEIGGGGNPFEQAANDFINTQNDLNFAGRFVLTDFVDALQRARGIANPATIRVFARYGSLPFEEVAIDYLPSAGYHRIVEFDMEYRAA